MKNENAIMDRIKARIAYHANEHRHTYEIGKGVMDFLARDLLADFKAAGGLLPPVVLDGDVYVIYRRKPVKAKVIFIGINADRLFFFNVLRGNIKANFQTYQFTENDIGRSVFLTLEEERNGNPDVWFACNESDNFICTPQDETECLMYGKESLCKYRSRKPEGVAVELADAVIRIADLCGHLGIDLEEVIEIKMAYNEGRPYKHGKKF